jgi:hypothetical protein
VYDDPVDKDTDKESQNGVAKTGRKQFLHTFFFLFRYYVIF